MFYIIFQIEEEPEPDNPEQSIRVKFMRCTPGGLYVWPEPADIGDQPITDIICPVDPPTSKTRDLNSNLTLPTKMPKK